MDFLGLLMVLAVFVVPFVIAFIVGFLLGNMKWVIILASVGILVAPSFIIPLWVSWAFGVPRRTFNVWEGLDIWSILFFSIVNIFTFFWFLGAMCGLILGLILSDR